MRLIKLKCNKCGHIKECLSTELDMAECPICNVKGTLKVTEEDRGVLLETHIKEHIITGFKSFGIEKTLELIESMTGQQKDYYVFVIKKYFRGLDKCFITQS